MLLAETSRVVAVCDLSPAAMNAAWRAAMLAGDLRVPLHLLHPGVHAARPESPAEPIGRFVELVSSLFDLQVSAMPVAAESIPKALVTARQAVVVIPCVTGNPIRERIMGAPAERLIRLARAPVLVVKQQAAASYDRVLVPVDLRDHSELLLEAGAMLAPRTKTAVFHSITQPGATDADSEDEARERRSRHFQSACRSIESLEARTAPAVLLATDEACACASAETTPAPVVAFGRAAQTILAAETGHRADVIVIGNRRRGFHANFLLGGVTQHVLARSEADVLVVPMPLEQQRMPPGHAESAANKPAARRSAQD